MNYELLQDAIVTRLQPFTTADISVEALPEKESAKTQVTATKARFTVIYAGSEYGGVNSTGQVSQFEKVFVQILIESSFLYGAKGIYSLASAVKLALTGFKAQGTRPFSVVKHNTIGSPEAEKKNNMWQYQVIFAAESVHVEDFEEDVSILVQKITLNDGNEQIVIPPEN